jgi:2-dehydro-3-deoxyphosphooctonate aldolase (KDO 8-P synthase)
MIPSLLRTQSSDSDSFFLIAGPCVVESEELVFETAKQLVDITRRLQIPLIFKSSFKKANRTKSSSFTGIGDTIALQILQKASKQFGMPTVTDIHETSDAAMAAEYVDVLQIPAFLCRQTDLLVAAAKTGKFVNIKKGQFLAPEQMEYAVEKVRDSGNDNIILTERGNSFGYQDLIVDYRGIPAMQKFGYPVVLDCTHSLQKPNQALGVTGGMPEMIEAIAKAGIAVGADGLFIETHPEPKRAKSDGANMLPLHQLEDLLEKLIRIRIAITFDKHH